MWHVRRAHVALAAISGIVIGVLLVLVVLNLPSGNTMTVDSRTYAFESESLFGDQSFLSYSFRGVTFTFHLWCQIEADTGIVCGNATELDGVRYPYSFSDGLPTVGPAPWQIWMSPDGFSAVEYQQGGHVRLLVEVL